MGYGDGSYCKIKELIDQSGEDSCGLFAFCEYCTKSGEKDCRNAYKKYRDRKKYLKSARLVVGGKEEKYRSTVYCEGTTDERITKIHP